MTRVKINPMNYAFELPYNLETRSTINYDPFVRICIYTCVIYFTGSKNTFLYCPKQNILKFIS